MSRVSVCVCAVKVVYLVTLRFLCVCSIGEALSHSQVCVCATIP